MTTLQPNDTLDIIKPRNATGARAWRVLHNGVPITVAATGKDRQFTESAANRYREQLRAERDDAQEAEQAAQHATQAQALSDAHAPQRVLHEGKRRLDGLSHEEAAARGYGAPSNQVVHLGSTGNVIWLAIGSTSARYLLRVGTATSVTITDTHTQGELYSGTLDGLPEASARSKHLLKLLPWHRVTPATITSYLEGVAAEG